jgi:hypothetical protein
MNIHGRTGDRNEKGRGFLRGKRTVKNKLTSDMVLPGPKRKSAT